MGRKVCYPNSKGGNYMIFLETILSGAYVIEIEKIEDERGFFSRIWDREEFSKIGLETEFVQSSISYNKKKGTIRGMHYQTKPYEENKIVRCTKGRIFDVIIDLRPESKSYKKSFSVELSDDNYKMLYIPKGFAHGFQTLENNTEILYNISQFYHPESSKGVRWNDKIFGIKWPLQLSLISEKDLNYSSFLNE